jgi:hypothetical protein
MNALTREERKTYNFRIRKLIEDRDELLMSIARLRRENATVHKELRIVRLYRTPTQKD